MLFNSYTFIFFFLPLSYFIYFFLLRQHLIAAAKGFLVFASLFFYSWWNIAYLPLILARCSLTILSATASTTISITSRSAKKSFWPSASY